MRGSVLSRLLLSTAALTAPVVAVAGPLAGSKPDAVQNGPSAGCIGDVQFGAQPGAPRVASGVRDGVSWKVSDVSNTPAVCSFPSAQPVDIRCVRNGLAVDPSYCQASQYQALLAQGYRTVGDTTNWSVAKWILPGKTDSGCVGVWNTQDGATPMGCGNVDVPVSATCMVTNVQSGTPAQPTSRYCASPMPASTRQVTDYRACGYAIETGGWSDYSNTCGTVTHTRSLTCRRSDAQAVDMTDVNCSSALSSYCGTHTCIESGGVTQESETVTLPRCANSDNGQFVWQTGQWVSSGVTCGTDNQTRSVTCFDTSQQQPTDSANCDQTTRPDSSRAETVTASCSPTPTPTPTSVACETGSGFHYGGEGWVQTGGTTPVSLFNGPDGGYIATPFPSDVQAYLTADVDTQVTGYQAVSKTEVTCNSSAAPSPTPTPTPTPSATPTTIQIGWCSYTSSGGGRYVCGPFGNYRGSDAPSPAQLCTGNVIAGDPNDATSNAGAAYQTYGVGPNWQRQPNNFSVAGAQCVIQYRAFGYSDSTSEGWESVFYDGPPTGRSGGLFIK